MGKSQKTTPLSAIGFPQLSETVAGSEDSHRDERAQSDERIMTYFMPNVGDILFCLILWLLLGALPNFLFGDGSTGGTSQPVITCSHTAFQQRFSFLFPPSRQLGRLSMAVGRGFCQARRLGRAESTRVFVGSINALVLMLLYQRCRKEGANFAFALLLGVTGSLLSAIHWLARPHVFNFLGLYLFSTMLEDFWRGELKARKLVIALTVCTVVWVNMHPACLFGLALVGILPG